MKTIETTEFKKQCLALLDELAPEGLMITGHGKPVARVLPYKGTHADRIGSLRHKARVKGDSFVTRLPWNASAQP